MSTGPDESAELKFVVTNTLIVRDVQRSVAFYRDPSTARAHPGAGALRVGTLARRHSGKEHRCQKFV